MVDTQFYAFAELDPAVDYDYTAVREAPRSTDGGGGGTMPYIPPPPPPPPPTWEPVIPSASPSPSGGARCSSCGPAINQIVDPVMLIDPPDEIDPDIDIRIGTRDWILWLLIAVAAALSLYYMVQR